MEAVAVEGEEREVLRDIHAKVKEGCMDDSVVLMVKGLKDSKSRTVKGAEWNLHKGLVYFHDRIYVPHDEELRRQIVTQHHDSKVTGHPGHWKTLDLVTQSYWWPPPHGRWYQWTSSRSCLKCMVSMRSWWWLTFWVSVRI
jgi:hypothetical protein